MSEITTSAQAVPASQPQATNTAPIEGIAPTPIANDDPLSARFAALARREADIVKRDKAAKVEAETAAKLRKEYEEKSGFFSKENIRKNPNAFFEKTGMTVEEFLQAKLDFDDGKALAEDPIEKIKSLEEKIEAKDKERMEKEAQAQKDHDAKQIATYKDAMTRFIKADTDKFELVNAYDAYEHVYDVIEEYFNTHQKMLSEDHGENIRLAADQVENYLFEYINKGKGLKKFGPQVPVEEVPAAPVNPANTFAAAAKAPILSAPTLTNKTSTATAATPTAKMMTAEESKRNAARLLKWT